jgi:hypothetical protein
MALYVPVPVLSNEDEGDDDVIIHPAGVTVAGHDVPVNIHEQHLTRLGSAGVLAHEHMTTFNKILDLNYEMDRKVVNLVQSLGVREVTSQSGHTGIPLAGGVAKAQVPGSAG